MILFLNDNERLLYLNENEKLLKLTEIEKNCLMKLRFFYEYGNGEIKQKYLILPDIYCWTKYFLYLLRRIKYDLFAWLLQEKCLYFLLFVTSYAKISNKINQH